MIKLELIKGTFKRESALTATYPMRILIIKDANGCLCMNSGDYDLKDGRIFFIPEEGLVRLEGEIGSGYWVNFSSALYSEFLLQNLDPLAKNLFLNLSFRDLEGNALKKAFSLMEQLKKDIEANKDVKFLGQYLSLFLGFTAGFDGYLAALTLDELQQTLRFRAILENFYKREKSIVFYAEGMGMSPKKLNSFLDRVLGKSLFVLIKGRVMREAEELLLHSDYTVDEIAVMLGFQQTSNFNNAFKRYKGISVSQFANLG
ncbi:helix-turn-helix domain-containing protein [Pedobacter petrophilus]